MSDKFCVTITQGMWKDRWPDYFDKFYKHCQQIAVKGKYNIGTVINYELRPLGGKMIQTKTQGWYLRWDNEASHTAFVLKWQ